MNNFGEVGTTLNFSSNGHVYKECGTFIFEAEEDKEEVVNEALYKLNNIAKKVKGALADIDDVMSILELQANE